MTKQVITDQAIVRGRKATKPTETLPIRRKSAADRQDDSARKDKSFNNEQRIGAGQGARDDGLTRVWRKKTPLAEREAAVLAGEQAADQRQDKADRRQDMADQRQDTADLRQETADLRQEAADLRQEAADQSDQAARAKAELGAITEAQMREANERLVVATLRAQKMTEDAEGSAARMSFMAEHDFLTGLPNRLLLTARLEQSIALAQRHGKRVAMLFIDLDHFKDINDSLGHVIGDRLLQSVAKRLQAGVRLSDTVCRQGGDEFVVLLAEVDAVSDAALTAEKLIKDMVEPHLIDMHRLHVTLSIGISVFPDNGKDVETVLANADIAMYHAKKSGRNKYQVFTSEMSVRAVARQSVQQALHLALEQDGFVLHYQPRVNIGDGMVTGAEALIRMRQSDGQLFFPTQFISIAEDCGLVLPIGKWVLREACRQTQAWLAAGLDMGHIAVNVSAVEFRSKGFLDGVCEILKDTGLPPRHLEIELTESGLMQDTETTTTVLQELKNLGVQLAIDDFGTGFSSLSYLQRFPIDTIKIDQSFVQNISEQTDEAAIVNAIIALGKSLRLLVVAEGIETRQQRDFLHQQECAQGQGYYYSRPVPAEEFSNLLTANFQSPANALAEQARG